MRIEPLGPQHDRARFRCGEAALDSWLRPAALEGVFVAVDPAAESTRAIAGFYTLSPVAFATEGEPDRPVALIARLARDRRVRGQRVGELLLADALARVLDHAPNVFAFAVEAPTETARAFYGRFGFTCLPTQPSRMTLLATTAALARAAPSSRRSTT